MNQGDRIRVKRNSNIPEHFGEGTLLRYTGNNFWKIDWDFFTGSYYNEWQKNRSWHEQDIEVIQTRVPFWKKKTVVCEYEWCGNCYLVKSGALKEVHKHLKSDNNNHEHKINFCFNCGHKL